MSQKTSALWSGISHGVSHIYKKIANSPLGRGMTSYQEPEITQGLHRPPAPARLFWAKLLQQGLLPKLISGFFSCLAQASLALYGAIGFFYGFFGVMMYMLLQFVIPQGKVFFSYPQEYLWIFGTLCLLSVPLLFSTKRAGNALLRGKLTGILFANLLGIPHDDTPREKDSRKKLRWGIFPALLLGLAGVTLTVWIHPLVLPACFLALALVGLIFTFPEAGVSLSVITLPLLWLKTAFLPLTLSLIFVTWVSFIAKWLLIRRTWRWGRLDMIMGLLCLSFLFGGFVGIFTDGKSFLTGLTLFLLCSLYFLISNLIKLHKVVGGCVFGVGLTLFATLPILYANLIHEQIAEGGLSWLAGSIGGDAIIRFTEWSTQGLGSLWQPAGVSLLLALLPLLLRRLALSSRALGKCMLSLCIGLCFQGMFLFGAMDALLLSALIVFVFCLLYSAKIAAAALCSLPVCVSGCVLFFHFFGNSSEQALIASVAKQENRSLVWQGLLEMLKDHPAGIGFSETALVEILSEYVPLDMGTSALLALSPLERLTASLGIPVLLLLLVAVFFLLQKSFTCLRRSGNRRDRAWVVSSSLTCLSLLVYGVLVPSDSALPLCFSLVALWGLTSAYETQVLTASATLSVTEDPTPYATDKVYRI